MIRYAVRRWSPRGALEAIRRDIRDHWRLYVILPPAIAAVYVAMYCLAVLVVKGV